jgi:hypothetical protein
MKNRIKNAKEVFRDSRSQALHSHPGNILVNLVNWFIG